jgi:uncharacterized protein
MSKLHLFRDTRAVWEVSDPPSDRIVSGQPKSETINVFESQNGKVFSGIWRATVGAWRVLYDETEYCHITRGRARLSDDDGTHIDLKSGDGFVIEAGFTGVWEVLEDMEKHYMVVLP